MRNKLGPAKKYKKKTTKTSQEEASKKKKNERSRQFYDSHLTEQQYSKGLQTGQFLEG